MKARTHERSLRWLVGRSLDAAVWRPSHALYMRDQLIHLRRNEHAGYSDRDHLVAAAGWLARAQDATGTGGVSGRYSLRNGWTSAYPETTGYIIPTFLSLGKELDPAFQDRAARCVEFLRPLQLADGGFPAGELHENRTRPSVFNTAQILHGLVAWHAHTGDTRAEEAAVRAANWLSSQQDRDGVWRTHVYNGVTAYTAHASCWLAEAGRHFAVHEWTRAAERHLDWLLTHVDSNTGWIDLAGFTEDDHHKRQAVTHTLAYTIWGLLDLSQSLQRDDALSVARRAAERIARRVELSGRLPGVLDSRWKPARSDYACVTGDTQMALIWFRLAKIDGDARFINTAIKLLDFVKAAQSMASADGGIRGGIPGSAPIWGDYLYMALPNWAAKYFVDALLAKRDALAWVDIYSPQRWTIPDDVPHAIPRVIRKAKSPVKVVMLSTPESLKVPQMVKAWASWGFRPVAVVLERKNEPRFFTRLTQRIRTEGFTRTVRNALMQRLRRLPINQRKTRGVTDVTAFCKREEIPIVRVDSLTLADAVAAVRNLAPDLVVHAGAGILRAELLAIPPLGTLNAHMGLLPRYRGMNVCEWGRLEGNPVGCSVLLLNTGLDTGDIVAVQEVDTSAAISVDTLRETIDEAQVALLGQAVRFIVETGSLAPTRAQAADEGRQYFRMHPDLKAVLEAKLH